MADDQVPGLIYGVAGEELHFQSGSTLDLEAGSSLVRAGFLQDATLVVANGNPSTVTIQLEDGDGADLSSRAACVWYLSDDANGDSVTASAPGGGVAVGTDGLLIEWTADAAGLAVSEADGDIDLEVTHTAGGVTWYLILVMPDGSLVASEAIVPTA